MKKFFIFANILVFYQKLLNLSPVALQHVPHSVFEIVLRRPLEILRIADFQASRANQLFHQHLELFWRFFDEPVHVLLLLFYKCNPINKRLLLFLVEALKVLFLLLMIHSTKLIWTKMDLIFDLLAIVCVWKCA